MPKQLLNSLYFYLGVIRRVISAILTSLNYLPLEIDSYIFAESSLTHTNSRLWSGVDFNQAMKRAVIAMKFKKKNALTDRQMRQLIESIISKHLPDLSKKQTLGAHHSSSGHTAFTASLHYGRDGNLINHSLNLSHNVIQQCLATSQVIQWFWNISPLEKHWKAIFSSNPQYIQKQNRSLALFEARRLAIINYNLKVNNLEQIKIKVQLLLKNHPWMGNKVSLLIYNI